MELRQATMMLSKSDTEAGGEKKVPKMVILWESVGLCYHKSMYEMNGKGYIIAHFNSGKIIVRGIKTVEQARDVMRELAEIIADWRFTLKEWDEYPPIDKSLIKEQIDALQKTIWENNEK